MKKKRNKEKRDLSVRVEKKRLRYHVYRSEDESLPFKQWTRLTTEPIEEIDFNDEVAEPGRRYFYRLTKVNSRGGESLPYVPKTTYTDHAGNRHQQNPLTDFAGYNMYRSAKRDTPLEQWERRNTSLLPTTEFKDEGVESGEIYFYYVRAVDSKGTESAPSEVMRVIRS